MKLDIFEINWGKAEKYKPIIATIVGILMLIFFTWILVTFWEDLDFIPGHEEASSPGMGSPYGNPGTYYSDDY